MCQTKVAENIKTHILCSIILFWKSCHLWDNVEKYYRARQATDDNVPWRMCFWADSSHCFEGSQCLYPQGQAVCFVCFDCFTLNVMAQHAPQNFGKYRSSDTVSHPRRHESSAIPLWELQTQCARKYIIPIHISSQTKILFKSDFILFGEQTIS